MSNETPTLNATKRQLLGSRYARRLRNSGRLPTVIYGHKQEPVHIDVDHKTTLHHLEMGLRVFNVDIEGRNETCLVKDIQFDYLGTDIIHMDMTRIDLSEVITASATLHFVGNPIGMKTPGAVLRTMMDKIQVKCKASDIPHEAMNVDISHLDAGDHITAGDVPLSSEYELMDDPEQIICGIMLVSEEAELPAEGAQGTPEIITESDDSEDADADADGEDSKS